MKRGWEADEQEKHSYYGGGRHDDHGLDGMRNRWRQLGDKQHFRGG